MSCVAAMIHNGKPYMASERCETLGDQDDWGVWGAEPKIWHLTPSNLFLGAVGDTRWCNYVRHVHPWKYLYRKPVQPLATRLVHEATEILRGVLSINQDQENTPTGALLIVGAEGLFFLDDDYSVTPLNEAFYAIGHGGPAAVAAYQMHERIREQVEDYCPGPMTVLQDIINSVAHLDNSVSNCRDILGGIE